jgi:hypothetical protein
MPGAEPTPVPSPPPIACAPAQIPSEMRPEDCVQQNHDTQQGSPLEIRGIGVRQAPDVMFTNSRPSGVDPVLCDG